MLKREYRKSRSIEAMTQYIREMLKDHVKESTPFDLSKDVDEAKSALIGYFQSKNSTAYEVSMKFLNQSTSTPKRFSTCFSVRIF